MRDLSRLLLATLLLATGPAALALEGPSAPAHEFTFVVLGDSQFHQPSAFDRIIDEIVHLYPAFVVQVGDMVSGYVEDVEQFRSQWQRFRGQIAPLGPIPFYPVPGNHDLLDARRLPAGEQIYKEVWGATYYSFDYRNAHFVVLNTDESEEAEISGAQLAWLREDLEKARASEHLFVFFHRPIYALKNEEALHALFVERGVSAVFYGHQHHYNYRERDGIPYIMTVSAAHMGTSHPLAAGSFHHMLLVAVRDSTFRIAVLKAGSVLPPDIVSPQDNEDLFLLQRHFFATRRVAFDALARQGDTYEVVLKINNPTAQDLTVFFEWQLPDARWAVEPLKGQRLALPAGSRDHPVRFVLRRKFPHPPEAFPSCLARLFYLTSDGDVVQPEYLFEIVGNERE